MSYRTLDARLEASACVIKLTRPAQRNAINLQMMDEIIAAAQSANEDSAVRALIITGGSEYFSAGADLNEANAVQGAESLQFFRSLHRMNDTLEALNKPVVAAIEGFCMTGGCELALACDIRVAGEGATFAITSSRIGTMAGAGGTQRLPRIVGLANALDMMFSAEPIDTDEAFRIGLVNRRTARGAALNTALAMSAIYAERAPLSLDFAKRITRRGLQMDLTSGLELEITAASLIYDTADRREGISAFLEKRKPIFLGR